MRGPRSNMFEYYEEDKQMQELLDAEIEQSREIAQSESDQAGDSDDFPVSDTPEEPAQALTASEQAIQALMERAAPILNLIETAAEKGRTIQLQPAQVKVLLQFMLSVLEGNQNLQAQLHQATGYARHLQARLDEKNKIWTPR